MRFSRVIRLVVAVILVGSAPRPGRAAEGSGDILLLAGVGNLRPRSAQRRGAAAVQVGTLPTQTDVKVRWPNGSIRFAWCRPTVPTAGSLPDYGSAQKPREHSRRCVPKAVVTLKIGGQIFAASLPRRSRTCG